MKNLAQFLEDNSGGFSATRLAFLLWAIGVLVVWMYTSVIQGKLAAIDNTIVAVLGILMTGKTVQRFGEQADSSDNANDPTNKVKQSLATIPPHQP